MKKFIAFIICMTVVPALILACAVGFLYNKYFSPTPMEYELLRGEEQICSVEYSIISFGEDGSVNADRVGVVKDTDGFIADLKSTDCYRGVSVESAKNLYDIKTLHGFVINYTDGSFEVITPYFCINSDLKIERVEEILTADVYSFDKDVINEMLVKYAPTPSNDKLPI